MIARYRGGARSPRRPGVNADAALVANRPRRSERLDRYDITGALEPIWQVVRAAQPARRASDAVAARKGRVASRSELDRVLYDLADGLRAVAIAVSSYLPETAPRDPRRARPARRSLLGTIVAPGSPTAAEGIEAAPPLFPRVDAAGRGRVIDTHAHLDACEDPADGAAATRARAPASTAS